MSNKQFLSILGMYNYDNTIFDNLIIPDGVDKELLINNILLDNAELSLVYTDLDFMKEIIGVWSKSELSIWVKLFNTFNEEYNPIWNVDENTTETRAINRDGSEDVSSKTSIQVESNQHSINKSTGEETSSNINSVKAFNSNDWSEHDKVDQNKEISEKTDSNITSNNQQASNDNSNRAHNEHVSEVFTRKRGGNIGVTMSQQLIQAELDVRPKLNIYKYISNSFKNRFCNMIY